MKSTDIRKAFLEYFKEFNHEIVSSSSLIPANDPTLLFTNAGMVQFKDVFLGKDKRHYVRAASSQRCVRAGGKHNDLENVGYTARHHTFFEMLGNFSFGDYFKRDAIKFAWTFLTEKLGLDPKKLWVTVFEEDDEAADIWLKEMKIDPNRFSRCGEKDNFWAMGDTGPCGPCTEIFYDHGSEIWGGPPGSKDADGDRYIEIWNLVFMQYNREANGKITPLPKPSVDTGMGLERISAVMQGVHNNYEIDLFQHLIKAIADIANTKDLTQTSLRVIADHIRSAAFLISDGVTPSNEGRGYVLRRIIRRALRHGHKLGLHKPFFHKLVNPLKEAMSDAYPELIKSQSLIEKILLKEEETFAVTLDQGLKIFESEVHKFKDKVIPGDFVFRLYDTYGFPMDLTADIARERGLTIDEKSFHDEMEKQRLRSQSASKFSVDYNTQLQADFSSEFIGYDHLEKNSNITALLFGDNKTNVLQEGQEGILILKETPFYAESGGQAGDRGIISTTNAKFEVLDTRKKNQAILHYGKVISGKFQEGEKVNAQVDVLKRKATALNHSATHLLNAALRNHLGEHVLQKGSLVEPSRLRFDFSHFEALSTKQIRELENIVNREIRNNHLVETKIMTPEEAMDSGAVALFGEKYGEEVRVLCMGDFSMELCGGTHVARTGDIGIFKIISEGGVAAGIRRIEAVTGNAALNYIDELQEQLETTSQLLKVNKENISEKIKQLLNSQKQLEKDLEKLNAKIAGDLGTDLLSEVIEVCGINLLVKQLEQVDSKSLRDLLDRLKQKLTKAIIVLTSIDDAHKIQLITGVTSDINSQYHAGELLKFIAEQVGGKGGGRPDMAQGAGNDISKLPAALQSVRNWVESH